MRTITIPEKLISENIQTVIHRVGTRMEISIGTGTMDNGIFVYDMPQRFETVIIEGDDYASLMQKSASAVFSEEDLWTHIDMIRSRS